MENFRYNAIKRIVSRLKDESNVFTLNNNDLTQLITDFPDYKISKLMGSTDQYIVSNYKYPNRKYKNTVISRLDMIETAEYTK